MQAEQIAELERCLCKLESLGCILESLCDPERELPDVTALADLGRIIAAEAMEGLDLLGFREPIPINRFSESVARIRRVH